MSHPWKCPESPEQTTRFPHAITGTLSLTSLTLLQSTITSDHISFTEACAMSKADEITCRRSSSIRYTAYNTIWEE